MTSRHTMYLFFIISVSLKLIAADPPSSIMSDVPEDLRFLVASKNGIYLVDDKNSVQQQYQLNATAVSDIDYHFNKNLLFWIDANEKEIHSQPLDTSETYPHIVFKQKKMKWQPVALAVDFISDKVYVVDNVGKKIDIFDLDGRYHSVIIGSDLMDPLDIKLDPYESYMFVLDGPRIFRAFMDGSSRSIIIPKEVKVMRGFSIDLISKEVYWSQDQMPKIMKSNYEGLNVTRLKNNSSSWYQETKFSVFESTIYWASDFEKLETQRVAHSFSTIKALHSSLQKPLPNPCEQDNGGCRHMCILGLEGSKNSHSCVCNVGWKLDEDSKNCMMGGDFMMYALPELMKSHFTNCTTYALCEPYLPIIEDKGTFLDFDYDSGDDYLYYIVESPIANSTIYRVHPNVSEPEIFLISETDNYQSLSIDTRNKYLYIVNSQGNSIDVINLRSKSLNIILDNLMNPTDIVVHPDENFVFFLQTNKTTDISMFNRAQLDGSNLITFDYMPLQHYCGYTIDFETNRIYWCNWQEKTIHNANLNFNDVEIIESTLTKYPYSMNVYKEWLYVVTSTSEGIWRFNKKTGKDSELITADFFNRITKFKVFSAPSYNVNDTETSTGATSTDETSTDETSTVKTSTDETSTVKTTTDKTSTDEISTDKPSNNVATNLRVNSQVMVIFYILFVITK